MSGEPEFLRIGGAEDSSFENSLPKGATSGKVIPESATTLVPIPPVPSLHLNYFSAMHLVSSDANNGNIQDMSVHSADPPLFVSERDHVNVEVILEDPFNHADVLNSSGSATICSPTHMIEGKDPELEEFLLKYPCKRNDFLCDVCQMKFTSFSNLRRHKLSHFGVRPFECRVCRRRFYRKDHMLEHVVRQHSKQRPFRCPFCNKNFTSRPHLKAHLATEHSGLSCEKRLSEMEDQEVKAILHPVGSHLGSSSSTSTHPSSIDHMEDMDQLADPTQEAAMDLTEVSQNFSFSSPSDMNPVIPTSSELSLGDSCTRVNTTPYIVRPVAPLLNMPSCSSSNVDSIPTFSLETSLPTTVSSSKNVELSAPVCEENGRAAPLCTSSNVKQEPIDEIIVDDSQSTCSSTIQPSSTMENNEMLDMRRNHDSTNNNQGDDETLQDSLLNRSSSSAGSERLERSSEHAQKENDFSLDFKPTRQHCGEQTYNHKVQTHGENSGEGKVSTSSVGQRGRHISEDEEESQVPNSCDRKPPALFKMQPALMSCCRAGLSEGATHSCPYCRITFPDQTLYLLHRSLHANDNPWKCNLCGILCSDKYDFQSHIVTQAHR